MMKSMNLFGSSSPEPQTLLPSSVANATEYTLKLLVDNATNEIYVISKVANNTIDPTELARLKSAAHVQKVFAKNKKIDGGINNFVNIGFDNTLGDIPAPGATKSVVASVPTGGPSGLSEAPVDVTDQTNESVPQAVTVTEADITALLTTVRSIVDATADDAYMDLTDADKTNNAIIQIVKEGVYSAQTKVAALQKLANAIAAVEGIAINQGDTAEGKAKELVYNANIAAHEVDQVEVEEQAVLTKDDIKGLLQSVQRQVQEAANDGAFNELTGNIIDAVKVEPHPAGTKDAALQKLANAIAAVEEIVINQGDTAEGKAIELVKAADIEAPAHGGNKYTYGKQRTYPKNVTFSKKTTSKQTHNKTVRKLQRMLNDL